MWTEPNKVENTEEKLAHVVSWVEKFSGRRWYPASTSAFDAYVEAVADIVWDKPEGHLWDKPDQQPHFRLKKLVGNDLEWLFKRSYARFKHCPSPRELRALYCEVFIPADGVELHEDLEENGKWQKT
jgi:hypothetical protein